MRLKSIYLSVFALLTLTSQAFPESNYYGTELWGAQANARIAGAEHIWLKEDNIAPAFIKFQEGKEPALEDFFLWAKKGLNLADGSGFKIISEEKDEIGYTHIRCQMTLGNLPIRNADFVLHIKAGKVIKLNGVIFKKPIPTNDFSLTESAALQAALQSVGATVYKWDLTIEEDFIKQEQNDHTATFRPKGEKIIVQAEKNVNNNDFRNAWRFDIYAHEPMGRYEVYVDATTGAILRKDDKICHADAPSTAATGYRGTQSIVSDSYNGSYRLRETGRGSGIQTFNLNKGTNYGAAVDFTSASTTWNLTNTNKDQYALDAHFGIEKTYDFYKNTFNRNSLNNAGLLLKAYVHYSTSYVNAFWDGTRMTFGDGNTSYSPLTSLDITGHEVTHGLTQYTADLDYSYESGALNESFSDIFGVAIEYFATPTQSNWTVGEDIGSAFRSMSNPNAKQQPDTYTGTYWYTGTGDNGGVHTNSGVQNYWYYLMCQGGSGTNDKGNAFNVTAVGRTKANAISYRNLTNYLVSTSNYADARFYALQSATDLYGGCSPEVISTGKAWYAVGVGTPYSATVTASFTNSVSVGCAAPFTVYFNNTSTNGVSYLWYFGDGTTSTQTNPAKTYNSPGVYTVKLVTYGGACGNDSVTKVNLVNINIANPCVANMPTSGNGQTQTSCTGTIYDDGGQYGAYGDNINSTLTIAPTGASKVQLTFTRFRMETNYDYIYIYDGPNITSPLLGSYTGNTLPASITSTAPSVTIKQLTDPSVTDTGFAINWSCILPNSPPTANFKSNLTNTCAGTIQFSDLSTGGATSWLWNFGDGNTSTQRNPTHVYQTNGTFTVSLTATNSFGANTKTITSMIVVNKPAAPNAADQSFCGTSNSFSIPVSTTNALNWYDSINGTNPISSNNPFVTPALSYNTTYYVEELTEQPSYNAGPATNSIGAGSIFNGNSIRALRFRVFKPSKLVSVYVYAQGDGFRTVQYRDTFGVVIAQKNVFVPDGGSRITLNIDLIASTSVVYELGVQDSMNMYRNSSGANFPYNDPNGIVSIIGNNIPPSTSGASGYYYYFYDWEVQEPGCVSLRKAVNVSLSPLPTASNTSTNVNCFGQNTGTASITVSGGTPSYQYAWSNGGNTASKSGLAAGTYTVTATDAKSCSVVRTFIITQPNAALSGSIAKTNINCFGQSTGSVTITAQGGTANYQYAWSGGGSSATKSNLPAGTYTVTITDAKNCTTTSSASLTQPSAALSVSLSKADLSCNGNQTGAVNTTVSGGTSPYSYLWSVGATASGISNLPTGTYAVTTTDSKGCTAQNNVTINEPTALSATLNPTNPSCGQSNGSVSVNASGGTGTITYLWSNGQTTSTISGLTGGNYQLTVKDANNCVLFKTANISNATSLSLTKNITQPTCFGTNNGSVSTIVNGGNPGYTYSWSNGDTTATLQNLGQGIYYLTVKDASQCQRVDSAEIIQPNQIQILASNQSPTCLGNNNGALSLTVNGGTPNYGYMWSNAAQSPTISGLSAGSYTVTVFDSKNCSTTQSYTVTSPTVIEVSIQKNDVTCFGEQNGNAAISVSGGTPTYTYNWSNGATTSSISTLSAGSYQTTVTDANGCQKTATVAVMTPSLLTLTANTTPSSGNNGTATAIPQGGTPPYNYVWSDGKMGVNITGLAVGNYSATVTDANGCTATTSLTIATSIGINTITTHLGLDIYPNPTNQILTVKGISLINYEISVVDAIGKNIAIIVNKAPHLAELNVGTLADGIYTLLIEINGKKIARKFVVAK